jgi:hypothetical protein
MARYKVISRFEVNLAPEGEVSGTLFLLAGSYIEVDGRTIRVDGRSPETLRTPGLIAMAARKGWLDEIKFRTYTATRNFSIGATTDRVIMVRKGDCLEYDGRILKYKDRTEAVPRLGSAITAGWLALGKRAIDLNLWERALEGEL